MPIFGDGKCPGPYRVLLVSMHHFPFCRLRGLADQWSSPCALRPAPCAPFGNASACSACEHTAHPRSVLTSHADRLGCVCGSSAPEPGQELPYRWEYLPAMAACSGEPRCTMELSVKTPEICTAINSPADDATCAGVTLDGNAATCTGAGGGNVCEHRAETHIDGSITIGVPHEKWEGTEEERYLRHGFSC